MGLMCKSSIHHRAGVESPPGSCYKDTAQKNKPTKTSFSPTGFSQISPSVLEVQGLALSPATSALSRYAQNPESLGSPGNHCSVLAVKGDMSSHPQYETFIFLKPTQGVSFCKRDVTHTHTYIKHVTST